MPRLLVIKGADEGKQFELTESAVGIGRDPSSMIRLHDTEVSRRHAEFRQVDGGGYRLVDVGSANGTFVNNQKISEAHLEAGDQIHIGQSTLVFSLGRSENGAAGSDLAERISLIARGDVEMSSAIIKTIGETEGRRILAEPDKAASPWLKSALANLTIMYEASQATSHILDQQELLDRILELVFRTIAADRGCVMLSHAATRELEPKAVRWREESAREQKFALSRTIVDHVLQHKQGVLVSDAAQDERFSSGQSIVKFGIREVICVPMKGRHETLGVLYLDTHSNARTLAARKSATAKFTEDHLALAIAVAHQAALAVEETRYHRALVQAERLAAIGQTIAALSHSIKNILQGLRSGSDIIKMGLKDKNDTLIQQGWRIAEKNQGKIYNLVMDMLSYSKERVPAVEITDLNEIVRDVFELMENRAGEIGAKFELKQGADLPAIAVDPEGIHRALLNIVGNALDAVENRPHPQVTVGTRLAEDGWLKVIVLDNGGGIEQPRLSDIFNPFVSTKGA
ncbi:MAG TPA: FHA domain-containing protein, partial [Gemmataceae bacterium]|nr:FHA domain-containing protein [Gemmataceae bacterium]